jgi:hypothetical protein
MLRSLILIQYHLHRFESIFVSIDRRRIFSVAARASRTKALQN